MSRHTELNFAMLEARAMAHRPLVVMVDAPDMAVIRATRELMHGEEIRAYLATDHPRGKS